MYGWNDKKMNKKLLILGISVLLICVGFSGCTEINRYGNDKESNDYSDDNSWDGYDNGFGGIEVIMVSGVDTVRIINYLDKPVKLMVSGVRNDVTVGKETNLVDVMLSGVDNIVRVSRSHSFTQMVSGVRPKIVYYDYDNWDGSDNDSWDGWDHETIFVSGNYIERTLHYLDKPVKLFYSGNYNDVTVTKETNLIEVFFSGNYNILRVSKSHSFEQFISGNDCKIVYYD